MNGKSCHERCRYSKVCLRIFGEHGSDRPDFPDECALYYKLDDLAMEAEDIRKEQERGSSDWIDEEAYDDESDS